MRAFFAHLALALAGIVSFATAIQFHKGAPPYSSESEKYDFSVAQKSGEIQLHKTIDKPMDVCVVHIPKTGGTMFKAAVQGFPRHHPLHGLFCAGNTNVGEHTPIPEDVANIDLAHVITMLREPSQRLASTFAFAKARLSVGGWNLPQLGWPPNGEHVVKALLEGGGTAANNQILGASYLGCQTNMMLGRQCMSGTPNVTDIDEAKRRIDAVFYVGLQEEWRLSMCLLNFKVTGERFIEVTQDAFENLTPGQASGWTMLNRWTSSHYDTTGYPPDVTDMALYKHAQERFHREVLANDINPPNCYHTSDGTPLDDQ